MNNRGSLIFGIITAAMIFLAGFTILNFIKQDVTTARAVDSLDCSNQSISDGTKLTCLGADATIPIMILLLLSTAGGIVAGKLT